MNRRQFLAAGLASPAALRLPSQRGTLPAPSTARSQFPRLAHEVFLNGAGGTPLGTFAEHGIQKYLDFIRLGPDGGRGAYREEVWANVRARFAHLIGAAEREIGLVECTKAGEQLVIENLEPLRTGGNVVTNDLHFSGSLHNYEGLRRTGLDVRVVPADAAFAVSVDRMADAIDARTALVAVSLVSNVNGDMAPVRELARLAHDRGALLFADIIQAAGAVPIDVKAMGIDVAAASSYKWLFGIHGAGFLYVRHELQGAALRDRLFPGHARRNFPPWVDRPDPDADRWTYSPPTSATRYQPGHVNYLGYAAAYEGLRFIERMGGVEAIQRHASGLTARLLAQLDRRAYEVLTPEPGRTPILALRPRTIAGLQQRLARAGVTLSVGGDLTRLIRISPAIYNTEQDIDRLAEALASPGGPTGHRPAHRT
jgi:selenocysteine lyase/cysteine desulfurase